MNAIVAYLCKLRAHKMTKTKTKPKSNNRASYD